MQGTNINRAYNMILTERNFGGSTHCYALVAKDRHTQQWNLIGGKVDTGENRGQAAARELYEETAKEINKRGDKAYWSGLSFYEKGKHKVFIHKPGNYL